MRRFKQSTVISSSFLPPSTSVPWAKALKCMLLCHSSFGGWDSPSPNQSGPHCCALDPLPSHRLWGYESASRADTQLLPSVTHSISWLLRSVLINICLPSLGYDFTLISHLFSLISSICYLPQNFSKPLAISPTTHLNRFAYQRVTDQLIAKYKFHS